VEEVVELAKPIIFVVEDNVHVKPTVWEDNVEMMDVEEFVEHVGADSNVTMLVYVMLYVLLIVMVENAEMMAAVLNPVECARVANSVQQEYARILVHQIVGIEYAEMMGVVQIAEYALVTPNVII